MGGVERGSRKRTRQSRKLDKARLARWFSMIRDHNIVDLKYLLLISSNEHVPMISQVRVELLQVSPKPR